MKTLLFGWFLCLVTLVVALMRSTGMHLPDLPDRWNPWAPLVVAETPNLLTSIKLARLSHDAAACRSVLAGTAFRFDAVPDERRADGCGWRDAVRVRATDVRINASFVLSCPAAVSLAMWERHVVEPAALQWFGQSLAGVEHVGSYACRGVRGRGGDEGRAGGANLSRHATAEALDVSGFVLADGRRVEIGRDWSRGTEAQRRFLRATHAGACRWFDEVLGPDYNAAHAAHFHVDRGSGRICR